MEQSDLGLYLDVYNSVSLSAGLRFTVGLTPVWLQFPVSVFFFPQVYSVLSYTSVHSLEQSGQSVIDSAHIHLFYLVTVAHLVQILLTSSTGVLHRNQNIFFYR